MKITYYGHSCFLIETGKASILFDPFISGNPLAKEKINIDSIEADFILLSHGHGDHIGDAAAIAKRTGAKIVSNYEVAQWFGKQDLETIGMNLGGSIELPFGKIKYVKAVHSSSFPDGSYAGNPGGFVVETPEETFYFAGDTALTMDMQLLGRFFDIDHAFLPIGDVLTMGVDDAVVAADFIKCKSIIGMHYNTFDAISIDEDDAKSKFESAGLNLTLFTIGQTTEF